MSSDAGGQPPQEWPDQQPPPRQPPPPPQNQPPPPPHQQWQFKPPGPAFEAIGAGCFGLWFLWSIVATFVQQPHDTTFAIEHRLCQNDVVPVLGGAACSRIDGFYTLATAVFWVAVVVAGWSVLARVVNALARPGAR